MINQFVLMVFFGLTPMTPAELPQLKSAAIDHVIFPYRAECDYAAERINAEVPGAKAFCFDVRVAGDRHEESFTQNSN
jgi:hypothetical protein